MWVKKTEWVEGERKIASLSSQLDLRKGQIARLEREIEYWRGKFEEAQNRADRAQDRALQAREMGPVSDLGMREFSEEKEKYEKMMKEAQKQAEDMFSDSDTPSNRKQEAEGGEGLSVEPDLLAALSSSLRNE